mmetsp:Transcript_43177/g.43780  ORF Transcript_43177/g.43780 Transcript_43177/m.43780 type:complete len:84 (+) Transcript_43177:74-325(+)
MEHVDRDQTDILLIALFLTHVACSEEMKQLLFQSEKIFRHTENENIQYKKKYNEKKSIFEHRGHPQKRYVAKNHSSHTLCSVF